MYLRHQSQVIFVAVYPFYVREKLNSLKILCSLRNLLHTSEFSAGFSEQVE